MSSATSAIRLMVGRISSGTATLGTRSRAILATCTDRSPIRSSSVTIRRAATTTRRSPATGCWRESSENAVSSTRSRARSISMSALITRSAISASPVSRASVAPETASSTWAQIAARSSKIESSWSWKASRMARTVGRQRDQSG